MLGFKKNDDVVELDLNKPWRGNSKQDDDFDEEEEDAFLRS